MKNLELNLALKLRYSHGRLESLSTAFSLLQALRPLQWIKNGFILMPLLFARKVFHYPSLLQSLEAVAIFCLLAGSVYLINDLMDLESDRNHPSKRLRPLAAGLLSPRIAKVTASVLLVSSLLWGAYLGKGFFLILLIYLSIQLLYSYRLKSVVILDIFCVSAGFFLRVIAGALAIDVMISDWLIICTVLISMFLALAKRRSELVLLGENGAGNHRKVLEQYSLSLLDQMIVIITACTLLSYMLYCISPETVEKFKTNHMVITSPFVLFGIFRYLYLIHKEIRGGSPEKVLFSDMPLLLSVILWGLCCMLVAYGVL